MLGTFWLRYAIFLVMVDLEVVLAETVIDFEQRVDDISMTVKHEGVEQLRQL